MNSNLNILVDCHVFDGSFQGTTTYLKGLYSELIKDKTKHFFLVAFNLEKLQEVFGEHDNVTYLEFGSKNKFIRLLVDIPRLITKHKIDFAHFQYIVPPIKRCKYIVTIHDILFLDFPKYFPLSYRIKNKFLFKWSAKHSDVLLTVSDFSKKQIQKHFNLNKVIITPNAVDAVYFEQYDTSAIKETVKQKYGLDKYWLFISRWEPRKNHYTLLKVFVENQYYNHYSLVFIGDKAIENKEYDTYYSNLPDTIKAKIVTLNKVDFKQLLLLLRGADLSVYPSIAEGFGIPPLESLAARIPTVCSSTTAMEDFSFLKKYAFNPLDKEEIKKKIELGLKCSSEEIREMNIQALEKYNWNIAAQRYLEVLKEE